MQCDADQRYVGFSVDEVVDAEEQSTEDDDEGYKSSRSLAETRLEEEKEMIEEEPSEVVIKNDKGKVVYRGFEAEEGWWKQRNGELRWWNDKNWELMPFHSSNVSRDFLV